MHAKPGAIVAGGSSGAVDALRAILPSLPADFAAPVVLVVHIPPDRPSALVEVLSQACALRVKEGEDKEPLRTGTIYVAPPNYHLLIERDHCLALSVDEPVNYSRPSIDVLFESAAFAYGASVVGLLLTGASEDGARGLATIEEHGGTALVQDPDGAAMPVMPRAALARTRSATTLALPDIGPFLASLSPHRSERA